MSRDTAGTAAGLVDLCHRLGREDRGLAILGEGNASADLFDGTFLVKASGSNLETLRSSELSRVRFAPILALLERDTASHEEVQAALVGSLADSAQPRPSVETFFHAACLSAGDASWVAHTHSLAVNQILCSELGAEPFRHHIFPDAIVVCGPTPAIVPYVDPGFELARAVLAELRRFVAAHGHAPKLLLMENHGTVALGRSAREALAVTLMAEKWAHLLQGTYALGGPRYLSPSDVLRIDGRSDEHYRRRLLAREAERPEASGDG